MSKTINSDLIRGNINTIILKALYNGDRYGYEIIKDIEDKSHGQYILKQPTLYSCLKRLESQGFITSYWGGDQSNGGRRKYYSLTDMGREVFAQSQDEYEYSRTIIDQLISERPYDLETLEPPTTTIDDNFEEKYNEADAENDVEIPNTYETQPVSSEVSVTEISETEMPQMPDTDVSIDTNCTPTVSYSSIDEILKNEASESYSENVKSAENTTYSGYGSSFFATSFSDTTDYNNDDVEQAYNDAEPEASELNFDYAQQPQEIYDYPEINSQEQEIKDTHDFYEYNSSAPSVQTSTNAQTQPNQNYRNVLSKLMQDFDGDNDAQNTTEKLTKENIIAESNMSVREKIQVRNFGKLTESIRDLGDDVKIRTPDSKAVHAYNKNYLYYKNKLLLFQFGALFLIMLLETFLTYIIVKSVVKINSNYDVALYICAILISLSLPLVAGMTYLSDPFRRKRADFNLRNSIIFRLIIMLQLLLITYAFNVYLGMPISGSKEYLLSLLLPMVLSTNVPVSGLIFNKLYKSKRFAVE